MAKRGQKSTSLLSGNVDGTHSVSPIDDTIKNRVRALEMTELKPKPSVERSQRSPGKQSANGRDTQETSLNNESLMSSSNNGDSDSIITGGSQSRKSDAKSSRSKLSEAVSGSDGGSTPKGRKLLERQDSFNSDMSSELDIVLPDSRASGDSRFLSLGSSELELYCFDHMCLVTEECRSEHAGCETLVPANEWAEAQTMERNRRKVEKVLQRFDVFAGHMINDRQEFKLRLADEKEEVTEQFLDVLEDTVTFLLGKQKQFLCQLNELHEKVLKNINGQIKRCKKIQTETSTCLQRLKDTVSGSDEYKTLHRQMQKKCCVYEEILRRDFNNSTRIHYEFRQDPCLEKMFEQLTSIGDVYAMPRPSQLPGFLSESAESEFSKKGLGQFIHHDGISGKDTNKCCFTGATFVASGRMVVADWNNTCLKLFNKQGVLVDRLELSNNPWDVKIHPAGGVVVTVPGEQKVYTVRYDNNVLAIESFFETDCECWGIVAVKDKLAVTCDPWSKTPSLRLYTFSGKLLAFFQKESTGSLLFAYPEHITTDIHQEVLYVSDTRKGIVLAVSLEGCVLYRYSHGLLQYPAGVATDNQGNVYVCGKESENIHQVSRTGELIRIIANKDNVTAPRAIAFHPAGESILVTDVSPDLCEDVLVAEWL